MRITAYQYSSNPPVGHLMLSKTGSHSPTSVNLLSLHSTHKISMKMILLTRHDRCAVIFCMVGRILASQRCLHPNP